VKQAGIEQTGRTRLKLTRTRGSLRMRLSVWLAAQTFVVLGLVCAIIYLATNLNLTYRQDALLAQRIEVIRHLIDEHAEAPNQDIATLRHKLDDFFRGYSDIRLTISIERGKERFGRFDDDSDPTRQIRFALPAIRPATEAVDALLELDISSDVRLRRTLAWALFAIALSGAMMVSLLGAWLVRRALAPIDKLSAEAATVSADAMGQRLNENQPDELRPLVRQFNAVLGRLEHAYVQMEGFNADVAHELRTPLATMIGETELALTRKYTQAAMQETLGSNLEELQRLSHIVTDMLFLSQAERGAQARRQWVDSVAVVATEVAQFHEAEAEYADVRIIVSGDAGASMDRSLIQRAMSNLVSNAVRYAPPGSDVLIKVERVPDSDVRISVQNQGTPIPPDALPRLFQRFFRADTARTSDADHHGLGLAIVAEIARMHGGTAQAQSDSAFTRVGFRFPAA